MGLEYVIDSSLLCCEYYSLGIGVHLIDGLLSVKLYDQ